MLDRAFFIVFHKGIAPSLTRTDSLIDVIRYFGVNQDHDKYLLTSEGKIEPLGNRDDVCLEYRLPNYDASLQMNGFMETSAYIHIYKNKLHLPYEFIGIAQYDMIWSDDTIQLVRNHHQTDVVLSKTKDIIFLEGQWHSLMYAERFPLDYIIESYNRYFKSNHTKEDLEGRYLTLWQTYFMHRSVFEDLTGWLSVLVYEIYPWANRPPYETHWGHLGALTERAEAIFFGLRKDLSISEIGLHHASDIVAALKISKEHYGSKQSPANRYSIKMLKQQARRMTSGLKTLALKIRSCSLRLIGFHDNSASK